MLGMRLGALHEHVLALCSSRVTCSRKLPWQLEDSTTAKIGKRQVSKGTLTSGSISTSESYQSMM